MIFNFSSIKTQENSSFSLEQLTKKAWQHTEQGLPDRSHLMRAINMLGLAALSGINCAYELLLFSLKLGPTLAKWGFDNIPLVKKAGIGSLFSEKLNIQHLHDRLYKVTNFAVEILLLPSYGVLYSEAVVKRHANIFYPPIPFNKRMIQWGSDCVNIAQKKHPLLLKSMVAAIGMAALGLMVYYSRPPINKEKISQDKKTISPPTRELSTEENLYGVCKADTYDPKVSLSTNPLYQTAFYSHGNGTQSHRSSRLGEKTFSTSQILRLDPLQAFGTLLAIGSVVVPVESLLNPIIEGTHHIYGKFQRYRLDNLYACILEAKTHFETVLEEKRKEKVVKLQEMEEYHAFKDVIIDNHFYILSKKLLNVAATVKNQPRAQLKMIQKALEDRQKNCLYLVLETYAKLCSLVPDKQDVLLHECMECFGIDLEELQTDDKVNLCSLFNGMISNHVQIHPKKSDGIKCLGELHDLLEALRLAINQAMKTSQKRPTTKDIEKLPEYQAFLKTVQNHKKEILSEEILTLANKELYDDDKLRVLKEKLKDKSDDWKACLYVILELYNKIHIRLKNPLDDVVSMFKHCFIETEEERQKYSFLYTGMIRNYAEFKPSIISHIR